jgi:hypothetical protein
MQMLRDLRHEDLAFLQRAPLRQTRTRELEMPADQVFAELAGHPERWPRWFTPVRDCRYEGDAPFGVGTARRLALRGGVVAHEQVLAWDENRRFAYRVEQLNVPGVRALMEEWTVSPVTPGRSTVQWVLAADCARPARMLLRTGRPLIDHVFEAATRKMAASRGDLSRGG